MIVNCVKAAAIAVPVLLPHSHSKRAFSYSCSLRAMYCASSSSSSTTINTEELRSQLDHLHAEAHSTRAKVDNARLRLLRLSEAAEKLQKQAAISIQRGDENDAMDMLFQRKKVLQALEKSKSRIELLDELSAKLSEAISLKESQLIGNVATNIEDTTEDDSSPVRIVAPKEEVQKEFTEDNSDPNMINFNDIQGNQLDDKDAENLQVSHSNGSLNEDNVARSLLEISSYEDFLEHIDQKLDEIESELVTVLNVSTVVLDSEQRPKNSRLQQTMELLESIRGIRQRIASIREAKLRV